MAILAVGSLNPHGAPVLRSNILANSITVTESDSVKFASGFVALGTAGALVLGHVVSISTRGGVGVGSTGATGAAFGSFVGTFATPSNNQTVGKNKANVDISKHSLYSAEESATIGTTTGSNLAGYYQDLSDEDTLNEGSAATTAAQYFGWGVNPDDTSKALVNIYESQVFGV
jgi:hypothetical protein